MFVKPAEGRAVPDPALGDLLPAEGREVPDNQYWQRRRDDGDVVDAKPAALPKAAPGSKATQEA